jgi:hypothetical protein
MSVSSYTIHARIGNSLLAKADRLFRNDDRGVFVELLQNSRRAGATLVDVTVEEVAAELPQCIVTIHDNGAGIQDFAQLLVPGESGWSEGTKKAEDPAGMGFYSLCLSGVEVRSRNQYALISPEAFLGKADPVVEVRDHQVSGTRLRFSRSSSKETLIAALSHAAKFFPVETRLNGISLTTSDFLEGAIYREVIDGIEIGFARHFTHDWGQSTRDENWNFYGARLREEFETFPGMLLPGIMPALREHAEFTLYARFNVLETGRVKLQLPDRRAVIQDEFLRDFKKKARAAAYRCFKEQERHVLPFRAWREARELGIDLPEAASRLTTWIALARERDSSAQIFGDDNTVIVPDLSCVMLVDSDLANAHTLQGALHSTADVGYSLYREQAQFDGYSWYDALPRITNVEVLIDGEPAGTYMADGNRRPARIDLAVTVKQSGIVDRLLTLPAVIHVVDSDYNDISFVAVKNSPWDNDDLAGPFAVDDFLTYATFLCWDEGDTWDTQWDRHCSDVEDRVNEYFRGPRASLAALIYNRMAHEISHPAARLKVSQIKLTREPEHEHKWHIEFLDADGQLI